MLGIFSGIKPLEWILIGVLTVLGLISYVAVTHYLEARDKNVAGTMTIAQQQQEVKTVTTVAELTDRVVADALVTQTRTERTLTDSRKGVINDYLNASDQPVQAAAVQPAIVEPPAAVAEPEANPAPKPRVARQTAGAIQAKASPSKAPQRVTAPSPRAAPALKLAHLADSMQQRFCRAVPDDPSCHSAQGARS